VAEWKDDMSKNVMIEDHTTVKFCLLLFIGVRIFFVCHWGGRGLKVL
jgi:hypothetical protein